jgi:hypothetical protein
MPNKMHQQPCSNIGLVWPLLIGLVAAGACLQYAYLVYYMGISISTNLLMPLYVIVCAVNCYIRH